MPNAEMQSARQTRNKLGLLIPAGCIYLPTYHQLHDVIHSLACESSNEKFVHMNVNKLVNKAAGVEAGQRATLALPQQSMLIVAQAVAANALRGAADHHAGYERVKQSLLALASTCELLALTWFPLDVSRKFDHEALAAFRPKAYRANTPLPMPTVNTKPDWTQPNGGRAPQEKRSPLSTSETCTVPQVH